MEKACTPQAAMRIDVESYRKDAKLPLIKIHGWQVLWKHELSVSSTAAVSFSMFALQNDWPRLQAGVCFANKHWWYSAEREFHKTPHVYMNEAQSFSFFKRAPGLSALLKKGSETIFASSRRAIPKGRNLEATAFSGQLILQPFELDGIIRRS